MRFILGMITGAALLMAIAYLHDTGTLRFGPDQSFVNWPQVHELASRMHSGLSNAWATHVKGA
jgi:hypothetical protein